MKKTLFESQRYLRERDHEAGRIACRRRTHHGRNDGGSDRWWLFLSYTYFSPRPSRGGNLFDLRPRRIAFGSPSSARPPPCSCGGATWAGCLDNPLFVAGITGNVTSYWVVWLVVFRWRSGGDQAAHARTCDSNFSLTFVRPFSTATREMNRGFWAGLRSRKSRLSSAIRLCGCPCGGSCGGPRTTRETKLSHFMAMCAGKGSS